ncbi:hypothetical protein ACLOJK_005926 [Asimina triloba]
MMLSHQQHYHRRQSAAAAPSPPSLRSTCTLPTSGMPINPFPSNYHFQEPACSILSMDPNYKADVFSWGAQFYQQPPNVDYGGITTAQQMQEEYRDVCEDVRETMFEKPLTPSDVGKLNRLVIPKQHAERYFPLDGSGSAEPGEKGVQLSFEDEEGKQWRFRYSYWNSSQSYVLTKGWSRFVKEKRLDAGDIVSFRRERLRSGKKLYIGWRRRDAPAESSSSSTAGMLQHHRGGSAGGGPSHQRGPSSYPASPAGAAALCIARQRDGLLHAGIYYQQQPPNMTEIPSPDHLVIYAPRMGGALLGSQTAKEKKRER